MRFLIALCLLTFLPGGPAQQQAASPQTHVKPCSPKQSTELPYEYRRAIFRAVRPPGARPALTIYLGRLSPLVLTLDAKPRLWFSSSTWDDMAKTITGLAASCQLGTEADEIAAQLNVEWKSADLTPEQFADLHRDLIDALGKYSAGAQPMYEELAPNGLTAIYLDAWIYPVRYETEYQYIEVDPIADPKVEANRAILAWVHRVDKLAAEKFHRPFPDAMDDW